MEPLASKYRPKTLNDFIGQEHLVGKDGPIRKLVESNNIPSMIFWGPPGTGKTTLAYIISQNLFYDFYKMQAVNSGKAKLMQIAKIAKQNQDYHKKTVLFLDEIHRWNKAQQDALLPYVEKGVIILIGATTENPSFTINNALLSRSKVFIFQQHTEEDIVKLLRKVTKEEYPEISIHKSVLQMIAKLSNGDIRSAFNTIEMATALVSASEKSTSTLRRNSVEPSSVTSKKKLTKEIVQKSFHKNIYYDRGEDHFNIISALHKSMRSSNPDAACYWTTRMLAGGEDPLYIARRLVRFASEDIGNADIQAIMLANSVFESCAKLGMPECDVHLMQLVRYLADAPKDNSAYVASIETKKDVETYGNLPVPLHLRNAPTKLMKETGYGKGYEYDHDLKGKKSEQQCMPDKLKGRKYT